MNKAPKLNPIVAIRNGPWVCAKRPPSGPSTMSGNANSVMPRLAIHSLVPRSRWTTAHSASNDPIITNSAAPNTTAPANGRIFSKSTARRRFGATVLSSTWTRATNGKSTAVATATTMNGAGIPKGPTSSAETAGPRANPNTSAARSRPRFWPRWLGSARITMRRAAGTAAPIPIPEMNRPIRIGVSVVLNPISRSPTTLIATPKSTTRRAWPRSANGAISTCDKNPATKPMPMTMPIAVSLMP
jgi:hypothetical protein